MSVPRNLSLESVITLYADDLAAICREWLDSPTNNPDEESELRRQIVAEIVVNSVPGKQDSPRCETCEGTGVVSTCYGLPGCDGSHVNCDSRECPDCWDEDLRCPSCGYATAGPCPVCAMHGKRGSAS